MLIFGVCECKWFQNTIGRHFLLSREIFQPFLELNSFFLELNLFPRSSQ
jgi:hypothetical protein